MVDTPKENNGDEATEDNPLGKQSKHWRHQRRSKPRHGRNRVPTQEMIAIRMVPKTKTIPPNQASSRPSKRMGKLALRNRQQMENQRMIITCPL